MEVPTYFFYDKKYQMVPEISLMQARGWGGRGGEK